MRSIPWLLAILAIVAVGWLARDARHRLEAMRSEVAALELVRDQALAAAGHAQARADSAAAVADSLDALRTRERADAEARARRLSREADSLETAIGAMVPEGELRTAVVEAVAGLRASYETRLADLSDLLARSDAVVVALQAERVELRNTVAGLEEALAATTEQRDLCMDAASPGLLQRLRDAAGIVLGTAAATAVVVVLLTG
jgi:chromosome segregation ATPase